MEVVMDEHFAAIPVGNAMVACVGGITRSEAEAAKADGLDIDGVGYYLFLADEQTPSAPIEILAKFFSVSQASRFARLIAHHSI